MPSLSHYLTPACTPDDRRSIIERRVEAELAGSGLEPWEERYCKWLALQPKVNRLQQVEVASVLAGRDVSRQELIQLRLSAPWRACWAEHREVDTALKRAKADLIEVIEKTPRRLEKALALAMDPTDGGLPDVRAATPLLVAMVDRILPKKSEGETGLRSLHITLSVEQANGLDASAHVVEAEELAEVVSVEEA